MEEEPKLDPEKYVRIFDEYDLNLAHASDTLEIKLYFKQQKTQFYQGTFTLETLHPIMRHLFKDIKEFFKDLQIVDKSYLSFDSNIGLQYKVRTVSK